MTRKAEAGFTLVEMIVALFIFGLVAATGVALLSFSVRAQAAAARQLDRVAAQQRMAALLQADFAQALPRVVRDGDGNARPAFEGTDGTGGGLVMTYVRGGRSNPEASARPGIERVDLRFENGQLLRLAYPTPDGSVAGVPVVLSDSVSTFRVRYRDKDGWHDRWASAKPDGLPSAVELTVARRGEPEIVTAYLVGTRYP